MGESITRLFEALAATQETRDEQEQRVSRREWREQRGEKTGYASWEPRMRYRLVVLTHGDMAPLYVTLRSFNQMVTPDPVDVWIHHDGGWPDKAVEETIRSTDRIVKGVTYRLTSGPERRGFCGASKRAWQEAVSPHINAEYVFWLEHDFAFDKPVDLDLLRRPLDADSKLAQMSLMRGPANAEEARAGGLFQHYRSAYDLKTMEITRRTPTGYWDEKETLDLAWLEHHAYFTTNPSLMKTSFMRQNPWPDYTEQCEGRFGIDLVGRGYKFGVWSRGNPWVTHHGTRTGFGY